MPSVMRHNWSVGYGLSPMDYMRRSDFPRLSRWKKVAFVVLLVLCIGLGVASAIFGNLAEVMGACSLVSVLSLIGLLTFMIRRSRPVKKAGSHT
jgi:hypothetical protein